ncbi:MAG: histidine phosphatase family protein [Candidatus Nanopelagicaceae bacterium]|nr:histidine phosphatase family protein [Candidatus Nanopelagicaceae bacterium]
MAINITYFAHGTSTDNEKGISSGWLDAELSKRGVKQSIELRDQLKSRKFDFVFCSDLRRASESAKLIFEGSVPVIPDARLRECNYGEFSGYPSLVVEPMLERAKTERFPGGECLEDVKTRIEDFLRFLKVEHEGSSVALVAHRAPQLALEVLLKRKTWEEVSAEDWRKIGAWKPGWDYFLE